MTSEDVERRFAAILAADVVKYSIHITDNEERTLQRFSAYRALFNELVGKRRGRPFGAAGDSLLAEFASPVEATRAAVEIQRAFAEKDKATPDQKPFQFRIGINLGDVMVDGENLYGEGVNLASRIEGLAEAGGVAISSHVHTYIRNKVDFGFEDQGQQKVKNADELVHVYNVRFSKPNEDRMNPASANGSPGSKPPPAKRAAKPLRRPPSKRQVRKGQATLETVMNDALGFMQRSTDIGQGGNSLPWLLFLGGNDAGINDLLETAAVDSPFTPPDQPNPAETFHWSWWFFKQLIAIETGQALVEGPSEQHRLDAWSSMLAALQANRPAMPITGIVICLPQQVLRDETERRDLGHAVRRLLDQATTLLKVTLPVYLVITRLDDIPGFAEFKAALPERIDEQVIGHLVEDPEHFAKDPEARSAALNTVVDRFLSLRLGMLRYETQPARMQGVFDFIGGFAALADGTEAMIDLLTAPTELQHDVRLRGVFWVGNGATPAFHRDLFRRFLPQDLPLSFRWSGSTLDDLHETVESPA